MAKPLVPTHSTYLPQDQPSRARQWVRGGWGGRWREDTHTAGPADTGERQTEIRLRLQREESSLHLTGGRHTAPVEPHAQEMVEGQCQGYCSSPLSHTVPGAGVLPCPGCGMYGM